MRGSAWLAVLALANLAWLCPAAAQEAASPMQFWLQQTAPPPQVDRPRRAAPVFRPRRARPVATVVQRRAPVVGSKAIPIKPAFVVAVFGDGFGYDAARGLNDTFADDPSTGVVDDTAETTSLVGAALPAWSSFIDATIKGAGRIDAAVLMLGSADTRPLPGPDGAAAQFGSPAWRQAYADRVRRTAASFRDRKVPLIWVGLPVVRDTDTAQKFAEVNAVFRDVVPEAGGAYVDSWEAFTDESGHYAQSGPDVNGQTAVLRRDDGQRFTRAGALKLASFIEPDLKHAQDAARSAATLAAISPSDSDVFDQALAIDVNAQIRREAGLPPLPSELASMKDGLVVDLTAAPLSSEGRLTPTNAPITVAAGVDAILSTGLAPPPRHGRTDDFSWPRP